MCGIVGIHQKHRVTNETLQKMCDAIIHRGPDDWGYDTDSSTGIAMRRLSIIDLSTGHQPIFNEDKTISIVCNGEIYNFLELRKALTQQGHSFSTQSDIEVIMHLYEEYGVQCVEKLNGMFAFIIWDKRKNKIFAGRDRLGVKPLYYHCNNDTLILASELKSITALNNINLTINPKSVDLYLQYQFIPAPYTIYNEVKKLLPGHYLDFHQDRLEIKNYWKLSYNVRRVEPTNVYIEQLTSLMKDSVNRRLISDVPFGAFLSGGIDSSAVVGLMAQMMTTPVKTFSIGFDGDDNNELEYARKIAKLFKTEHHEYVVKPPAVTDLLPKLIDAFDEPFADSSAIPTFIVSQMAGEHVKMVLSGDGADESFAGYHNYQYYSMVHRVQAIPKLFRQLSIVLLKTIPNHNQESSKIRKAIRFLEHSFFSSFQQWQGSRSQYLASEKTNIYSHDFTTELAQSTDGDFAQGYEELSHHWHNLNRMLFLDLKIYLADGVLVKVDRMSMANSIEVRSPFLDYRIAEFAAQLPPQLKLNGLTTKFILKKALENLLPKDILHRKKQGFSVPLDRWFRVDLANYAHDILLSNNCHIEKYFHANFLANIIGQHQSGQQDHRHKIWALLNLELWHQKHSGVHI